MQRGCSWAGSALLDSDDMPPVAPYVVDVGELLHAPFDDAVRRQLALIGDMFEHSSLTIVTARDSEPGDQPEGYTSELHGISLWRGKLWRIVARSACTSLDKAGRQFCCCFGRNE